MTDSDAVVAAAARERRRLIIVFTAIIAVVAGTLTAGWVSSANGREDWHEQAMTWQDRYIELYDEFTVTTGEEPDAPEPADVAGEAPDDTSESTPGAPGPVGPRGEQGDASTIPGPTGAPGKPGDPVTSEQVAEAVAEYCADGRCMGDNGESVTGPQGEPGESIVGPPGESIIGPPGRDGKDSTIPGPQGVGITSISCMEDGTWRFTLTDGVTQEISGPCRVTPEPVETPTAG